MQNTKRPSVIAIILFVLVILFVAWIFYRIVSRPFTQSVKTVKSSPTPAQQVLKSTPTPQPSPVVQPTAAQPLPTAVGLRELIIAQYPDTAQFFVKNKQYTEENTIINERPNEPNVAYLIFEKRLPGGILGEVQCFALVNNQTVQRIGKYLRTGNERKTTLLPYSCTVK